MDPKSKYVIFGAGIWGMRFYAEYGNNYDINCFCDNDKNKQGTKYLGLPVIAPEEIKTRKLKVIIPSKKHFEMAQQLFVLGIKDFYLLRPDTMNEIVYIDLNQYEELSHPMRICAVETRGVGSGARALKKYNPYEDIDICIFENGFEDDIDIYGSSDMYYIYFSSSIFITQVFNKIPGKKCIELWHGFTIKALWDASYSDYENKCFDYMNEHKYFERDAICSYSRLYSIFFGFCMKATQDKFHITGMPRNDLLMLSDAKSNIKRLLGGFSQKHIVFYIPTHRDYYDSEIDVNKVNSHIFSWADFDIDNFDTFLAENDILFVAKFHYYEAKRFVVKNTKNIVSLDDNLFNENDMFLYEVLGAADILITDYSSVSVDFLLLDKPIIYAVQDIEKYSTTRGLMTEPFDEWAPGENILDFKGLKTSILGALLGEDEHKEKRDRIRKIMHKYDDAQSTRRVLDLARKIIEDDNIEKDKTI